MVGGGKQYLQAASTGDPLLDALYDQICQDLGEPAEGTAEHKTELLKRIAEGSLLTKMENNIALRRWFDWVEATPRNLRHWHSRLLLLTALGLQLQVWPSVQASPLHTGPRETLKKVPKDPKADEEAEERKEAAATAAKAASSSAASSSKAKDP